MKIKNIETSTLYEYNIGVRDHYAINLKEPQKIKRKFRRSHDKIPALIGLAMESADKSNYAVLATSAG